MKQYKELKELIELALTLEEWFEEAEIDYMSNKHEILPIRSTIENKIIALIYDIQETEKVAK